MLDAGGVPVDVVPWSDWSTWIDTINSRVDVGLQCSFTESFNYVALEHMLLGKPVITSPAIRYAPSALRVNPDDPAAVANRLLLCLDQYDRHAAQALYAGRTIRDRNNQEFVSALRRLLVGLTR